MDGCIYIARHDESAWDICSEDALPLAIGSITQSESPRRVDDTVSTSLVSCEVERVVLADLGVTRGSPELVDLSSKQPLS